jgi:hypothetical protein
MPFAIIFIVPFLLASSADASSCLTAICGPVKDHVSQKRSAALRAQASPDFTQLWDNVLAPEITEAQNLEREYELTLLERIEDLTLKKQSNFRSGRLENLVKYNRLRAQYLTGPDIFDKTQPFGIFKIDPLAVQRLLSKICNPNEREAVRLMIEAFAETLPNTSPATKPTASPLLVRLLGKYPDLTEEEAQKKDAQNLLGQLTRYKNRVGQFYFQTNFDSVDLSLLQRAASGRKLSPVDANLYCRTAKKIEEQTPVFTGKLANALDKILPSLPNALQKLRSQSVLTQLKKKLSDDESSEQIKKPLQVCGERLKSAYHSNTPAEAYVVLDKIIQQVKVGAKAVGKKWLASDLLPVLFSELGNEIDSVDFLVPANPADDFRSFHLNLRRKIANRKALLRQLRSNSQALHSDLSIIGASLAYGDSAAMNPLDEIANSCDEMQLAASADYTLVANHHINLSWYTVNYPHEGFGIVAHEMGHVLSNWFRAQPPSKVPGFLATLNCVANRNPFVVDPVKLDLKDNTTWSEEDLADHFSALILSELSTQEPTPETRNAVNHACALLDDVDGTYRQNQLAPAPEEVHSSPLLRVLMTAIDNGNLPVLCQPLLTEIQRPGRELRCNF